jgi:hypothetical protein
MSEQYDGSAPDPDTRRPGRRRPALLAAAAVALLLGLVLVVVTHPSTVSADAPRPTATSTAPSTVSGTSTPPATAVPSPTVDTDPAALADLDAVAAGLPTPLALSSPATWDQWLPEGKPFPGPSLEEEISTCPRMADRLGTALGQRMSYWTGTLPGGGCTWVPVPLEYDTPDYDYVISIGFEADGETAASLAGRYATARGPCPWHDVPAVAPGGVLVRCAALGSTEYTLAVPDTRVAGGLWIVRVSTKDRAAVPAAQVFRTAVEGAVAAYG